MNVGRESLPRTPARIDAPVLGNPATVEFEPSPLAWAETETVPWRERPDALTGLYGCDEEQQGERVGWGGHNDLSSATSRTWEQIPHIGRGLCTHLARTFSCRVANARPHTKTMSVMLLENCMVFTGEWERRTGRRNAGGVGLRMSADKGAAYSCVLLINVSSKAV